MLQSGDTLAGYRIETIAGVGGMGVVYKATQMSLDRPVALKVLSSTLVGNRTFRERFRREGRHAAALDHPNIIPVYEAGESNGLMFIAMRLVDGPSLMDLIAANEVSGSESLRIVGAIASALDAAHGAGLVHRDIKPQNILLTTTGHPYLADFGITKGTDHGGLTHSGDFVGSLNYVAPEQIDGKDVTGASDIYSLTAVLFQCLSGVHPYDRETDAALMHAHLAAPPPTLSERGAEAPPGLDAVFERGMAKAPDERFPTAAALVDTCRETLASLDAAVLRSAPAFPPPRDPEDDADEVGPVGIETHPDQLIRPQPVVAGPTFPPRPAAAQDLTAADIKRAPATPGSVEAPRPARTVPTGRIAAIAAGVLVLAAPVAGYTLGHDGPAPEPASARSAALSLDHDASWSDSTAGIEGLKLDQAVQLRRTDGIKLVAGRMSSYASGFDPVPKALRERFAAKSTATTIRIGTRTAARHSVRVRSGEHLWLALAPDSKGWIALACEGLGAEVTAACPMLMETLTVTGATAVPLGPSERTATAVSAAIEGLNRARSTATPGLRSKSTKTRASTARTVGEAHASAARTVTALELRPQERPLFLILAKAMRAQGSNFDRLASAATSRRRPRYNGARTAIKRGERQIKAALDRLKSIGYNAG